MANRVYIVKRKSGGSPRLVSTNHPAIALRHVAEDEYTVAIPSQEELFAAAKAGVDVEKIKAAVAPAAPAVLTPEAAAQVAIQVREFVDQVATGSAVVLPVAGTNEA